VVVVVVVVQAEVEVVMGLPLEVLVLEKRDPQQPLDSTATSDDLIEEPIEEHGPVDRPVKLRPQDPIRAPYKAVIAKV
jgi:hypothetical protein